MLSATLGLIGVLALVVVCITFLWCYAISLEDTTTRHYEE